LRTRTGQIAVKELSGQKKPQKQAGVRVLDLIIDGKLETFST
jgi:hypothetical protein